LEIGRGFSFIGEEYRVQVGGRDFYIDLLVNENPSVGVILCTNKNNEIAEYALSRNLSSTMVSEYTLKLIDKKLLQS
jgi:predicted nuclease of restriction endonuclease-like (RecB) superfamily